MANFIKPKFSTIPLNFIFPYIILTSLFYSSSSLKLNKNYTNGQPIKGLSKSTNQQKLFLWTAPNNQWEVLIYNHSSNNLNFPFDTQNLTFNITQLNINKIISSSRNDGKFIHLFKYTYSNFCYGDSNSINTGIGICHELKATNQNISAFPVMVTYVYYWPSFCYLEIALNPPQTVIRNYGENYIYAILNEISLDMFFLFFDGFYNFCLITKSITNYSFIVIVKDQNIILTKSLALATGFEQYVGTKLTDHTLLWTQKTAYIHLNTGTQLLNTTLNDFILDMTSSQDFIYVLTLKGIFQYFRKDFSLVTKINATFHQNSKIDFVKSINQLACISDKNIMFYTLEQTSPESQNIHQLNSKENQNFVMQNVFVIVSILSVIRPYNLHSTFLLLSNFDLYNFHQTNYSHFFGQVLKQVRNFENKIWNLIPLTALSNWMRAPYFSGTYETFSNQKIVLLNGNDGLFFQNTKPFFLLWLPISFILFFTLNRLYLYLKKTNFKKGKRILKGYSFWTNFLIMAVIQNSYIIVFYSISNLNLLFFFIPSIKIIQIITILFFGLFFLIMASVFPFISYFHHKKAKIILNNPKSIFPTIVYNFLKYFSKIIIECGIHYFMFNSPGKQKMMLSIINFSSVLMFIYFEYKYETLQQKIVIWSINIGQFIFVIFNICLFFQYNYLQTNPQIIQLFNQLLENCLVFIIICSIITTFFPSLQFIINKIINKNKNKFNINVSKKIIFKQIISQ